MKILVTGSSRGIGKTVAVRYLELGHEVIGLDLNPSSISHERYTHYICDIKNADLLPNLSQINVIFNNAGLQNCSDDIENNLKGTINITEKYIKDNKDLKAILFNASASASTGQEFPLYVASKSGLVGYMKNVAIRLASQGVLVNSISLGGVLTESNKPVIEDEKCWSTIMARTPLKKWMSEDEVADWVIFLTLQNKSMSGQDILIDNGERDLNPSFVWPK